MKGQYTHSELTESLNMRKNSEIKSLSELMSHMRDGSVKRSINIERLTEEINEAASKYLEDRINREISEQGHWNKEIGSRRREYLDIF